MEVAVVAVETARARMAAVTAREAVAAAAMALAAWVTEAEAATARGWPAVVAGKGQATESEAATQEAVAVAGVVTEAVQEEGAKVHARRQSHM